MEVVSFGRTRTIKKTKPATIILMLSVIITAGKYLPNRSLATIGVKHRYTNCFVLL